MSVPGSLQRGDSPYLQSKVEDATSPSINGEADWAKILELVDLLNTHPETSQAVLHHLNVRLHAKEHGIGIAALRLLESLMKNCPLIHPMIGHPDFLKALVKIIPRQLRKPYEHSALDVFRKDLTRDIGGLERWDLILSLVQSWALSFKLNTPYTSFYETYRDMQRRGVKFPEPSKEESAPVLTPPVNQAARKSIEAERKSRSSTSAASSSAPASSSPYRDSECTLIYDSLVLFYDLLYQSPSGPSVSQNDLIQELRQRLLNSHKTIQLRLNDSTLSESKTLEYIQLNDQVLEALEYYQGIINGTAKKRRLGDNNQKENQNTMGKKDKEGQTNESDSEEEDEEESESEEEETPKKSATKPSKASPESVKSVEQPKSGGKGKSSPSPEGSFSGAKPVIKLAPPAEEGTKRQSLRKKREGERNSTNAGANGQRQLGSFSGSPLAGAQPQPQSKPPEVDLLGLFSTSAPAQACAHPSSQSFAPVSSTSASPFDLAFSDSSSFNTGSTSNPFGFDPFSSFPGDAQTVSSPGHATAAAPQQDEDPFLALATRKSLSGPAPTATSSSPSFDFSFPSASAPSAGVQSSSHNKSSSIPTLDDFDRLALR